MGGGRSSGESFRGVAGEVGHGPVEGEEVRGKLKQELTVFVL